MASLDLLQGHFGSPLLEGKLPLLLLLLLLLMLSLPEL